MADTKFVTVEAFNAYMQRIKNYFDKVFEVDSVTRPTSSSNYVVYHVTIPGITSLTENLRVRIHKGLASADPDDGSGALKLLQINNLTPIAIFWRYNSMATWNQLDNVCMTLTYRSNARPTGSDYYGYTLTAGFIMDFTYDSGNDMYSLFDYSAYKVGPTALESYGVVGYSEDGKYNLLVKADGTLTNNPFDYARGAFRWESGAKTANASYGTWDGYLYERRIATTMSAALINKYGFNTINPEDSIYLKCTKSGRLMTVVGMVKNLPTTADNYYYMLYAHPYQAYTNSTGNQNWSFFTSNPVFKSVNGVWVPLFEECGIPTIIDTASASTLQTVYDKYPNQTVNLILRLTNGGILAIAQLTICYRSSNTSYYVYGWMKNGGSTTGNNFFSVWTQSADMTKTWLVASASLYGTQINLVQNGRSIQTGDVVVVGSLNNNANCYTAQAKTTVAFDTSETNKFLCQDGTWKTAGGFEGKDYSLVPLDCYNYSSDVVRFEVQSQNCLVKINPDKLSELISHLQVTGFIDKYSKEGFIYEIGNAVIEVKNNYGVLEIVELHSGTALYIWDYDNGSSPVSQIDKIAINLDTSTYFIANYSSCHPVQMFGGYAKIYLNIFDVYIRKNMAFGIINGGSLDAQNSYQHISLPKKYITTELYKFIDSFGGHTFTIRIALHNLGVEDIGKKIYLYRLRTNRSIMGNNSNIRIKWKHPIDCNRSYTLLKDGESDAFGFGLFNNDNGHGQHINLPFFMDNEYIKTEWTITQKDLIRGYIDIEANKNWRNLLKYSDDPTDNIWIVGCRTGRRCMTLNFKFGFVDVDETVIYMADEIVKIGSKYNSDSSALTYNNWYNVNKCENILSDFFYVSIN